MHNVPSSLGKCEGECVFFLPAMRKTNDCALLLLPKNRSTLYVSWMRLYGPQLTMAYVIVTLKIMPEGVDVSLSHLEEASRKAIEAYGGKVQRVEQEPIGFGLVALKMTFSMDENKGTTDVLEDQLKQIPGIMNVEVVNVGRALG